LQQVRNDSASEDAEDLHTTPCLLGVRGLREQTRVETQAAGARRSL
jgi:hypothetical protein